MSRQGSRDPLACLRVVPDTSCFHRMNVRSRTCRAVEVGNHDERADRPLGRSEGRAVAGIVPSRRNSWLNAMRLPESVSGEAISCGGELAMDNRRVSGTWRFLSRGFLSGTPINWRGRTWNTVATPPRRTAKRGSCEGSTVLAKVTVASRKGFGNATGRYGKGFCEQLDGLGLAYNNPTLLGHLWKNWSILKPCSDTCVWNIAVKPRRQSDLCNNW